MNGAVQVGRKPPRTRRVLAIERDDRQIDVRAGERIGSRPGVAGAEVHKELRCRSGIRPELVQSRHAEDYPEDPAIDDRALLLIREAAGYLP
jgi:hypothetical protein